MMRYRPSAPYDDKLILSSANTIGFGSKVLGIHWYIGKYKPSLLTMDIDGMLVSNNPGGVLHGRDYSVMEQDKLIMIGIDSSVQTEQDNTIYTSTLKKINYHELIEICIAKHTKMFLEENGRLGTWKWSIPTGQEVLSEYLDLMRGDAYLPQHFNEFLLSEYDVNLKNNLLEQKDDELKRLDQKKLQIYDANKTAMNLGNWLELNNLVLPANHE